MVDVLMYDIFMQCVRMLHWQQMSTSGRDFGRDICGDVLDAIGDNVDICDGSFDGIFADGSDKYDDVDQTNDDDNFKGVGEKCVMF